MAREFSKPFYNSARWKKTRKSYMNSIHWLCERCKCNTATQVHHKVYLTPQNIHDHTIALGFNNLEGLCDTCHAKEHNPASSTADGVRFDSNGNLVVE